MAQTKQKKRKSTSSKNTKNTKNTNKSNKHVSKKKKDVDAFSVKEDLDKSVQDIGLDTKQQKRSKKRKEQAEKEKSVEETDRNDAQARIQRRKTKRLQRRADKMISTFQQEYDDLRKLVGSEANDFQTDKANLAMLRSLLTMTLEVIGTAEQQYYKYRNQSAAYALVTLVSQARELANDIRNMQNLDQQVEHISNEIIAPAMRLIAQNMISEKYHIEKMIEHYVKSKSSRNALKKGIEDMMRNQGHYISESMYSVDNKLREYLLE